MNRRTQGGAADVIRDRARNIEAPIAEPLRSQSKIDVVEIGKEVLVQATAIDKYITPVQERRAASRNHRRRRVELSSIFIHAAQSVRATCNQHGIAGAIEMCALRRTQQFACG